MRLVPLVAALGLWLGPQGSVLAAAPAESSVPFRLVDNRVFADVTLNGQGPFHFILDTGGSAAVSDQVARRLGLKVTDGGEGEGVGAARAHFGATRIARVDLGPIKLANVDFIITSNDDASQVFGTLPEDGVIGPEIFERVVVRLDYSRRTLIFIAPDSFRDAGMGTIVPFTRPRQIPEIAATLDGVAGQFGVDTGARSALLLYGPFCAKNGLAEKYHATLEGVTGWGFGGPVRSLLARAGSFSLGGASVNAPVFRLSKQKTGLTTANDMAGLIGPDVLRQFIVTFDYARQRMILEKGPEYGRRDSYDRAGAWMGQAGPHFAVVDVIKSGPADEAGVKAGDVVLAIDGVDTSKLFLPDVRESMRRRAPGTKIRLALASQGRTRIAIVTLRDLV
jgi:hypothetical protein